MSDTVNQKPCPDRNSAPADAKFCPACGLSTVQQKTPPALKAEESPNTEKDVVTAETQTSPVDSPSSQEQSGVKCSKCSYTLTIDSQFCNRCGTPVAKGCLLVIETDGKRRTCPLHSEVIIGAGRDCHVVVEDDRYVSKEHMRVFRRDSVWYIEDLQSTNGTLLDINKPTELREGDQAVIGQTRVWIENR